MSDLVERLRGRARFLRDRKRIKSPELMEDAAARITELETALAEAEGRVIAEVVAWLRTKAVKAWGEDTADTYLNEFAATALETGEWKK